MSFGWKDVGRLVAKSAPLLATALGGPAGAIAGAAGALLGSALGIEPTPDNVAKALVTNDPTIAVKLAEIEANHSVALAQMASQQAIAQTNADRDIRVAQEQTDQVRFQSQVNESDLYTKQTRPKIARQSWYTSMAYGFIHMASTIANALDSDIGVIPLESLVFLALASPAMAYTGARTIDIWKRGGAKSV